MGTDSRFRIGERWVDPSADEIDGVRVDARAMEVLVALVDAAPGVLSVAALLERVWPKVVVVDNVVHQAIAQLRKALGDEARSPRFIETIPRRGYRLIAEVEDRSQLVAPTPTPVKIPNPPRGRWVVLLVAAIVLAATGWWVWPVPAPPARPDGAPPLTAIAVLPFDDLSQDGDHAWLAEGMAEDLIDALSRIDKLHVPARRSTSILKAQGADLPTIGQRLDVGTVVEGSVRREGDHISVVARWVRIDDRSQLWSSRYDRRFEDVIAIQREVAIGIAEAIRTELGIQDAPASVLHDRYSTADVRAWELYRRALALSLTFEPSKRREAREMLLRAIEYDPDYVAAHVRIAINDYYDDLDKGVEGLKSALQMDPYNAGALSTLAWDSAMRFWDYETAERLLTRIPKHEQSAEVLAVSFQIYSLTGRLNEALRSAEQSIRIDPMWARGYCDAARIYELQGESESAGAMYERGISVADETGQYIFGCRFYFAAMTGRGKQVAGAQLVDSMRNRNLNVGAFAPCNPNAFAESREEKAAMYACLAQRHSATREPAKSYVETIFHQAHAATRVMPLFMPHHDDPRFKAHLRRLDERMARAAGTYERRVGLQLPD